MARFLAIRDNRGRSVITIRRIISEAATTFVIGFPLAILGLYVLCFAVEWLLRALDFLADISAVLGWWTVPIFIATGIGWLRDGWKKQEAERQRNLARVPKRGRIITIGYKPPRDEGEER
jgi:ABC-type polysaccharide/polyol phosphate export permease